MSAIDTLQKGDWIKGNTGTHWVVTDTGEYSGHVRLLALDDAELTITTDQFETRLTNGAFERTTPPEGDQ